MHFLIRLEKNLSTRLLRNFNSYIRNDGNISSVLIYKKYILLFWNQDNATISSITTILNLVKIPYVSVSLLSSDKVCDLNHLYIKDADLDKFIVRKENQKKITVADLFGEKIVI